MGDGSQSKCWHLGCIDIKPMTQTPTDVQAKIKDIIETARQNALIVPETTKADYIDVLQHGPIGRTNSMGTFHYEGWVFRTDVGHSGHIWTTPDVVAKYGFTDDKVWYQEGLDFFHIRYDWQDDTNDGADPAEYPENYAKDLADFENRRYCYISHCFYVEDPDGNVLGCGDETPFGIIGSEPFTCWWNGFPHAMLAECSIDSWCDG